MPHLPPSATRWLPGRQLQGDEQVMLFLRRHWFVLAAKYAFMFLLALIPIVAYFLFDNAFAGFISNEIAKAIVILMASIYYLVIWVTVFTVFIDYYLDIWIVTTHRIIDIEQKGLFNHQVAEQSLEMVQDVSSRVKGVIPTLFDYGFVLVQSAAAKVLFEFKQIPEPAAVAQVISRVANEYRDKHNHQQ